NFCNRRRDILKGSDPHRLQARASRAYVCHMIVVRSTISSREVLVPDLAGKSCWQSGFGNLAHEQCLSRHDDREIDALPIHGCKLGLRVPFPCSGFAASAGIPSGAGKYRISIVAIRFSQESTDVGIVGSLDQVHVAVNDGHCLPLHKALRRSFSYSALSISSPSKRIPFSRRIFVLARSDTSLRPSKSPVNADPPWG